MADLQSDSTNDSGVSGTLTDGTGVSALSIQKYFKDFLVDFMLGAVTALASVNILGLADAVSFPDVAGIAIGGAAIRAAYRTILKWAQTP